VERPFEPFPIYSHPKLAITWETGWVTLRGSPGGVASAEPHESVPWTDFSLMNSDPVRLQTGARPRLMRLELRVDEPRPEPAGP